MRLQAQDSNLSMVICGYFLKEHGKWLLGGACDDDLQVAAEKAPLEVLMMRKDWSTEPVVSSQLQPKRSAFYPHWDCQREPEVRKSSESIFEGRGKRIFDHRIDRTGIEVRHSRSYSSRHIVA